MFLPDTLYYSYINNTEIELNTTLPKENELDERKSSK